VARIRRARAGDVARVAEIEATAFSDPWSRASFASLVDDPGVLFAVAEADGEVVGYSVVWAAAEEAELANVAVTPEVRGTGVGRQLLDAAMAAARRHGGEVMFLEVRESNAAARRLYATSGFTQVGRRRRYYRRPVEDALVLRAWLSPGAVGGRGDDHEGGRR
jgi:ribosomal-protein-alanine N-acetyltransferase